jgi:hypothetical protein
MYGRSSRAYQQQEKTMDLTIVTRLAKEGKQHGLTLQWAQVHLIERLSRTEQRLGALRNRDTRESLADAQMLQLENEALALVLEAVRRAYPAGADIDV